MNGAAHIDARVRSASHNAEDRWGDLDSVLLGTSIKTDQLEGWCGAGHCLAVMTFRGRVMNRAPRIGAKVRDM